MAEKRFGKARPSGQPSDATERKIRVLLELVRNKFVVVDKLAEDYETSERSLLRDLQELRRIGERAGFRLAEKAANGRVHLEWFDHRPTAIDKAGEALRALIQDAGAALGPPVESQLSTIAQGPPPVDRRFLRFLQPRLREGTRIAKVYESLRTAWENNARVTFVYSGRERRLEPACVLVRSGRYYLLGRDPSSKAWKYYALDSIDPPIARAGSFTPEAIPAEYQNADVIGFMRGSGSYRVSVWLSPAIAASASSREWQHGQEVLAHNDGSATMTFTVSDIGEVIRWALGFGAEAKITGPDEAVALAREMAEAIAKGYAPNTSGDR